MVDYLASLRPIDGPGLQTDWTPNGVARKAAGGMRAGGGQGGSVECYVYQSQGSDHIVGHSWNGATEGEADVLIAKPPHLWRSITNITVRGTTVAYEYEQHSIANGYSNDYRLAAYSVDVQELRRLLERSNFSVSAGQITENGQRFTVRPIGEFRSVSDVRNLLGRAAFA